MTITESIQRNAALFESVVWPAMREHVGAGNIYSLEMRDDEHSRKLDMEAGIDSYIEYMGGLYPMATRVRRGTCFNDFTIRRSIASGHDTEYQKVQRALERQSMHPRFQCTGYVDSGGNLRAAAFIETGVLWAMAARVTPTIHHNGDGTSFQAIAFDLFTRDEVCVIGPDAPRHLRRDMRPFIEESTWR